MPKAARLGLLLVFLCLLVAALFAAGEWVGFFEEVVRDERPPVDQSLRVEGVGPDLTNVTIQLAEE